MPSENINNHFFDGYYKEIWRSLIPEALTKAEIDFLVEKADLKSGSKVLDLMCGYGRHSIGLGRKGIQSTAVDNLKQYISEIEETVKSEKLPVTVLQDDVMKFRTKTEFDLVICMGNSLSFFNLDESLQLLSMISACLKTGSKFIFNSWMIAEIAIKQFKDKSWAYINDVKYLSDSSYFFSPARIESESMIIDHEGKTEVKKAIDYIYSLNEVEAMLNQSGFDMKETWSIPGKKKFNFGDPRIYFVAEKTSVKT
jgi:cyclopropane fatty-acyl-phospholipid synthase-like methyltransferase